MYFYQSLFDNISMCKPYLCILFCFYLQINIASFHDEVTNLKYSSKFVASTLPSNNSEVWGNLLLQNSKPFFPNNNMHALFYFP